jgi:hypothetical protein
VDPRGLSARVVYHVGQLRVEVTRQLEGDAFTERYAFTNTGTTPLPLARRSTATFTLRPIQRHYTNAADVLEHRSHAHLWLAAPPVGCLAHMGGRSPHLGWVLTEGSLSAPQRRRSRPGHVEHARCVPAASVDSSWPRARPALAWSSSGDGWDSFFEQPRSRQFVMEASYQRSRRLVEIRASGAAGQPSSPSTSGRFRVENNGDTSL